MNDKKPQGGKPANNALPVALDKVLQDILKDILTPPQQKQVLERLKPKLETMAVSVLQTKYRSGPLPASEEMEGYERVVPGSFARIIAMAEKDQDAVIESARFKARSDSRFRTVCVSSGLAALIVTLGVIIYLASTGHDSVAIAVAGFGIAGVIATFVNARLSSSSATG